jgi:ParB family chromosome partitioning protein
MNAVTVESPSDFIPLNRLRPSPKNVRKVAHTREHICSLADSIRIRGQLQNLVVEPELSPAGEPTGLYLVTLGEGRRLAQLERVERGEIAQDHPIACRIDTFDPSGASLAENTQRAPMHPADEFEAFKERAQKGESIEDIAASFSVSPEVVRRRLKLANVAPSLFALYRASALTLEQLMAFTVIEDHERQEQLWAALRPHERDAHTIRQRLVETEVSNKSALARFVGQAYERAGGAYRVDLFSKDGESFAIDVDLLRTRANDKLARAAKKLQTRGTAWTDTRTECDLSDLSSFCRVRLVRRDPTENEAQRLQAIETELHSLEEGEQETETCDEALAERYTALEEERQAIEDGQEVPDPEQQALAGAVVTIDDAGKLLIHNGLLKPEDAARFRRAEQQEPQEEGRQMGPRVHSSALARRITAHRTAALRATIASKPKVALALATRELAVPLILRVPVYGSSVHVHGTVADLKDHASDIVQNKAHQTLSAQLESWRKRLPDDAEQVLPWLLRQTSAQVEELLALCIAMTVNDVTDAEDGGRGGDVRAAAGLDMLQWWEATASTYFGSVSKAQMAAVLREAVSEESASTLMQLKKGDAAKLAEQRVAGKGWLPPMLRSPV